MEENLKVVRNPEQNRFEVELEGQLAKLDYLVDGDSIIMTHVGVPYEFRGHGVAGVITKAGLEYAKAKSLRVIPMCSYVAAYIRRNPQYAELTKYQGN